MERKMKKGEYYWLEMCSFESCIFSIRQTLVSDAAQLSSAINASTELFTILRNQSGNLKLSIFISKTHLLRFL